MANYEYKCPQCETKISVNRGITEEDPGYECETCKVPLNKVYSNSNFGITFNGSGFYRTDK